MQVLLSVGIKRKALPAEVLSRGGDRVSKKLPPLPKTKYQVRAVALSGCDLDAISATGKEDAELQLEIAIEGFTLTTSSFKITRCGGRVSLLPASRQPPPADPSAAISAVPGVFRLGDRQTADADCATIHLESGLFHEHDSNKLHPDENHTRLPDVLLYLCTTGGQRRAFKRLRAADVLDRDGASLNPSWYARVHVYGM